MTASVRLRARQLTTLARVSIYKRTAMQPSGRACSTDDRRRRRQHHRLTLVPQERTRRQVPEHPGSGGRLQPCCLYQRQQTDVRDSHERNQAELGGEQLDTADVFAAAAKRNPVAQSVVQQVARGLCVPDRCAGYNTVDYLFEHGSTYDAEATATTASVARSCGRAAPADARPPPAGQDAPLC